MSSDDPRTGLHTVIEMMAAQLAALQAERATATNQIIRLDTIRQEMFQTLHEADEARDAALADVARLRAIIEDVVATGAAWVAGCCGPAVNTQFCEQYGCGSVLELIDPLIAVLDGRTAKKEAR